MEQQVNSIEENKTENIKKRRAKQGNNTQKENDKVMKYFIGIVVVALIIFVAYVVHNSRCIYYQYIKVEDTDDNSDVSYEEFKNGFIKYNSSGIEFQKDFGESVWNESVSLHHPIFSKSENYVLVADLGGNQFTVYNETGKVSQVKLKYPILQANISNQGICQVIIEADQTNMVQVYDKNGEMLVDAKASLGERGYPITAAISPDGTKLAISYYALEAMTTRTTISVYDLSSKKKEDADALIKEFTYESEMAPKLYFNSDSSLIACADTSLHFYQVSETVKEAKKISLKSEIESVFEWGDYLGVIYDNSNNVEEERYKICVYDLNGEVKMEKILDMNYEKIQVREKQLFAIYKNECTIMDIRGRILFQGELEGGGIAAILPAGGFRSYHVIFNDRAVKMRLQFWKGNNDLD